MTQQRSGNGVSLGGRASQHLIHLAQASCCSGAEGFQLLAGDLLHLGFGDGGGGLCLGQCGGLGRILIHDGLGLFLHFCLFVIGGRGEVLAVVQRDHHIGQLDHLLGQVAAQLLVRDGGLALRTIDQIQQDLLLQQQFFKLLQGGKADAVGLVHRAVLVHQLLGVGLGLGLLQFGQLTAQLGKPGLDGGVTVQVLLGLFRYKVRHSHRLAPFRGDLLAQKSRYLGGVLVFLGQVGSLLVGIVLGQQIVAGGDIHLTDAAHALRGGEYAAGQAAYQGQAQHQSQCPCKEFVLRHVYIAPISYWGRMPAVPVPGQCLPAQTAADPKVFLPGAASPRGRAWPRLRR